MVEDKSDYTQFISKAEVAKARAEAAQLLKENPHFNRSTPANQDAIREEDSDHVQSDEDYEAFGARCFNPSPEEQKIYLNYMRAPFWNYFAIGSAVTSSSISAIAGYCQTDNIGESLLIGTIVGAISGAGVKAYNYFKNERPLKQLGSKRDKLSSLEK